MKNHLVPKYQCYDSLPYYNNNVKTMKELESVIVSVDQSNLARKSDIRCISSDGESFITRKSMLTKIK